MFDQAKREQLRKVVGKTILAARDEAGMSQTDVERVCGIPKARQSRYENGHVMPSLESFRLLALAVGVEPGKLLAVVEAGAA